MYKRNILIVDDDQKILNLYIPKYNMLTQKIQMEKKQYSEYKLNFEVEASIESAMQVLKEKRMVDVLIIDYRFNNSPDGKNGTELVKYVRENINKHCRVIFYTMHNIANIPAEDIVSLVNNQIYRLIDKGKIQDKEFVELIYEAAVSCDIVVTALEHFWDEYKDILSESRYTFLGEEHSFADVIVHIRKDDDIGRTIVDKLLHKALIDSIEY